MLLSSSQHPEDENCLNAFFPLTFGPVKLPDRKQAITKPKRGTLLPLRPEFTTVCRRVRFNKGAEAEWWQEVQPVPSRRGVRALATALTDADGTWLTRPQTAGGPPPRPREPGLNSRRGLADLFNAILPWNMSYTSERRSEATAFRVLPLNSSLNRPPATYSSTLSFVLCLPHLLFSSTCKPALVFECGLRRALK